MQTNLSTSTLNPFVEEMKNVETTGPPLTKIRIAPLAELPAAPKAQIKRLFICLAQLVAVLNSCKGLLSIAVSDEAIVVTGGRVRQKLRCSFGHMPRHSTPECFSLPNSQT